MNFTALYLASLTIILLLLLTLNQAHAGSVCVEGGPDGTMICTGSDDKVCTPDGNGGMLCN